MEVDEKLKGHGNIADDVVLSDYRIVIRERQCLKLPNHIVSTREDATDVVENIIGKYLDKIE